VRLVKYCAIHPRTRAAVRPMPSSFWRKARTRFPGHLTKDRLDY